MTYFQADQAQLLLIGLLIHARLVHNAHFISLI